MRSEKGAAARRRGTAGTIGPAVRAARRGPDGRRLEDLPGLLQDAAEDLFDLVEVGLVADQRRGELDDGVTAVIGPAVEPGVEQRLGQEAAQQPLGLLIGEGLLGGLVLDQLDAVEV